MICSSAGISDSRAVEAEALGAGEFEIAEFLEAFGLDQLLQDGAAALAGETDFLVRALDALLDPGLLRGVGDVHELDAERLAVGALADRDDFAQASRIRGRARDRGRSCGRNRLRRSRRSADRVLRDRAAPRCRADRAWRGNGRACGRRGSASRRAPNRASPGGRRPPISSAPLACALAASLAPTAFSTCAQLPSSAEVRSSRGVSGQLSRPQDGALGVLLDVGRGVLQAFEELLPFGVDRGRVLLVAGVEIVDVGGVGALQKRGEGKCGIRVLARHDGVLVISIRAWKTALAADPGTGSA